MLTVGGRQGSDWREGRGKRGRGQPRQTARRLFPCIQTRLLTQRSIKQLIRAYRSLRFTLNNNTLTSETTLDKVMML